jgi:transcriptional regulator with XRE-family HTH domain
MAASAERIKELLGNGLSNEVVATAVGVTAGYISQLMADEQFSSQVVALRTQTLAAATVRDRSWDGLEDTLLGKLAEKIEQDMIYKPMDLLRALSVINNAKRRGASAQENFSVQQTVVTLNLPTVVINSYKKNKAGEVIEVTAADGTQQTLVTMPASALMHKLSEQHQGNKKYEQVRKFLPSSSPEEKSER